MQSVEEPSQDSPLPIPHAIQSLLHVEIGQIEGRYTIDPCCGDGDIPMELHNHGLKSVHGSDEQSTWPDVLSISDYRSTISMWKPSLIISAPSAGIDFADLISCAWDANVEALYLLLPLSCLSARRCFNALRLSRLWLFRPVAQDDPARNDSNHPPIDYGWFVFERDYNAQTWSCGYLPFPENPKRKTICRNS
ncbi:hypothetical protein AD930_10855 [Acetobacter malorum]|nr:hypothetical protein AD930_10855 [Acetobacter malorum]